MKHICIIGEQSFIGGIVKTGVSEFIDGLAYSLTPYFKVSVMIPNKEQNFGIKFTNRYIEKFELYTYFQICNINYYILKDEKYFIDVLNLLKPDIIQSIDLELDYPNIIYGIDEKIPKKQYNKIITFSEGAGKYYNCEYLKTGIADEIINPENGLFIPMSYNVDNLEGKEYCKKCLIRDCALPNFSRPLFLYMGRITSAKGEDYLVQIAEIINKYDGDFICVGPRNVHKTYPYIRFVNNWVSQEQTIKYLAGADFYISASLKETAGLMPRHAARYGAIPVLYLTTGLKDDFNESNCFSLDLENLESSLLPVFSLYFNKEQLNKKIKQVMSYDFSWKSRIGQWVEFYESFSNNS